MKRVLSGLLPALLFIGSCQSGKDLEPRQFPSDIRGTLQHQGYIREYALHISPVYNGTQAVPLVLFLHGGGGNATSAQNFTQLNPVADQEGFIAVYPQGFGPAGSGFSWADGRSTSSDQLGIDDVGFIDKLLEQLVNSFNIDTDRIYVSGFSNGSFMTQRLACERNGKFAAMASLGSTISTDLLNHCIPQRPIPMLLLLGDADPFIPYAGGNVPGNATPISGMTALADFWKTNNRCRSKVAETNLPNTNSADNSFISLTSYTDCDCQAEVRLYQVYGGGHTWPGVENKTYELLAGETNEDIQASQELWAFFKRFFCVNKPFSDFSEG